MKMKLALGVPLVEPYFAELDSLFDISLVSSLNIQDAAPGEIPPSDVLLEECLGSDIVVIESDPMTEAMLVALKKGGLKLLVCCRSNPVNIDVDACRNLDIPLLYTPGRNVQSVAEQTIAMMLMLLKHLHRAIIGIHEGNFLGAPVTDIYQKSERDDVLWINQDLNVYKELPLGYELFGKTLGLIGFGLIGRKVAELALAFGMIVNAYDPYCDRCVIENLGANYCDLEETLSSADIVSIHLPVNDSTIGLVDKNWFGMMKKGAFFINTARAIVVDQEAMIDALRSGQLAGAAVDVMWIEPCPSNHPFVSMENVIMLPHIAGNTHDIERWQSAMLCEDLVRFHEGKAPLRVWR